MHIFAKDKTNIATKFIVHSLWVWRFSTLCSFYTFILINVANALFYATLLCKSDLFGLANIKRLGRLGTSAIACHVSLKSAVLGNKFASCVNIKYSQVSCATNWNIKPLISALVFAKGKTAVAVCDCRIDKSSLLNMLRHNNKIITDHSHIAIHPACLFYCFARRVKVSLLSIKVLISFETNKQTKTCTSNPQMQNDKTTVYKQTNKQQKIQVSTFIHWFYACDLGDNKMMRPLTIQAMCRHVCINQFWQAASRWRKKFWDVDGLDRQVEEESNRGSKTQYVWEPNTLKWYAEIT